MESLYNNTIFVDNEHSLFFIRGMHIDLVISRERIHEFEELITRRGIHKLIDLRQGEATFGACLIQVGKIYVHSPFSICLLYQHHIWQPL